MKTKKKTKVIKDIGLFLFFVGMAFWFIDELKKENFSPFRGITFENTKLNMASKSFE